MRRWVFAAWFAVVAAMTAAAGGYAVVEPGRPITFPRDYGSHPEFHTEWWYVTGWLTTGSGEQLGFQVTFFRTNPGLVSANPSAFAPHQLLIAHCALSDAKRAHLWQDQRIRRAGLGLAEAAIDDTDVHIDDWSLKHDGGIYRARIAAEDFRLDLDLKDTQPPLRNGDAGVSRKGPDPASASYYYSLPHLKVAGFIVRAGRHEAVTGEAWFDHEWSSSYLDDGAQGWDWLGINLDDGSALMAFRIRGKDGKARWAGGTFRPTGGEPQIYGPDDVNFVPLRYWASPRTGVKYPVAWRISIGTRQFTLEPIMNDQENDTRLTTGAIYWEGAIQVLEKERTVGRGYLELTGYGDRLELR